MQYSKKDLHWNFFMGLMHGILFNGGVAFSSSTTVIPAFINMLTPSTAIIGFSYMIMGKGRGILGIIPQLFVANHLESKTNKKPLLVKAIVVRATSWGILAFSTFLFAKKDPVVMLWILIVSLGLFTLMGGFAAIPFSDIFGKAIPSRLRGRFFALRGLFGGIVAIIAGIIVRYILKSGDILFPRNFGLIFTLSFIFVSASYIFLSFIKEPIEPVHKQSLPFSVFIKKVRSTLANDLNFRNFLIAEILIGASSFSLPFYIIYAKSSLHFPSETVGTFLTIQMIGIVISNLAWGYVSDYIGNKTVIVFTAVAGFLVPLVAYFSNGNFYIYSIVFLLIGFMFSGMNVGYVNFVIDSAPSKERPTYIGLNGTLTFPILTYSLIGGILVKFISYKMLFIITFVLVFAGFIIALQLKEPRLLHS
ncbi:MAG: MFS transporter [Caldisericaceae bacterium]|nr:MFS transporter [Caldisericaceae bacterium]